MTAVITKPDTEQKLDILSTDAQYDLACACGTRSPAEHRRRGPHGRWIYPVTLPNGGTSLLFKTLLSNACTNDCLYCPLREQSDVPRCTLGIDETARTFLDYHRRGECFGLFLSSGVIASPDATMHRLNGVARRLRTRYGFKGYIHLKVIPGASDAAIEEAVSLSSAVSLNIETPGPQYLSRLSDRKDFLNDIIRPIKLISRLTGKGMRHSRVKQTTQFIVGAAGEPDSDIVRYMGPLYRRLNLQRIYFSAYQHNLGQLPPSADRARRATQQDSPPPQGRLFDDLPDHKSADHFMREHRLYQVDFLMRKYGFTDSEIIFDGNGQLSLDTDPKEIWAQNHPEYFPVDVNRASKDELLRVPGLGPITVQKILEARRKARLNRIEDLAKPGPLTRKAKNYLKF